MIMLMMIIMMMMNCFRGMVDRRKAFSLISSREHCQRSSSSQISETLQAGLTRRTASDKILLDKAFNIAKNPKHDRYQRGLASMVYKFFVDKSSTTRANKFSGSGIKNENISNKELAEE